MLELITSESINGLTNSELKRNLKKLLLLLAQSEKRQKKWRYQSTTS